MLMFENAANPGGELSERYFVQVLGNLPDRWSTWFDGFEILVSTNPEGQKITTLSGAVRDQAELHGLLQKIRDLGLNLLLVQKEP
jgi:hypothetical protein